MKKYIIKQEDDTDCGACALLSIIKYYEGYVPLEVIKNDTLTNELGTNFYYLKLAAEKYGFNTIGKKITELKNIKLPCIAQLNMAGFHHFITIYKIDEKITYMDSSKGIVVASEKEFSQLFTGYILELTPAGKIMKYENSKVFKTMIVDIYHKYLKEICFLFFLSLVIVILFLVTGLNPVLLKNKSLIPLVIILSFSKILISYIKNSIMSRLNKKINIDLLKSYLERILNLPLKYMQLKKTGDFINRINDLENIKNLLSKSLLDILINSLMLIFGVLVLLLLEIKLTAILLLVTVFYTFILLRVNRKTYQKIILSIESENNLMDKIIEYLNNIKTVKTNPLGYFKDNLNDKVIESGNSKLSLEKIINIFELISSSFEEVIMIIILVYYYYCGADISTILIYITIYSYYLGSIKYYVNLLPSVMYFKDVITRIKSIYDISEEIPKYQIGKQDLYLQNISYSFDNINPILNNFNLKIKSGNKVLIKGVNGSGKSTLLDIIYGSITDYSGLVIKSEKISYFSQNDNLFSGTILENIILNNKYDKQKLYRISQILLLDNLIKSKPNGYYSRVSTLSNLSGGECQKIMLARSLYQDFDILLLDESLNKIFKEERQIILQNIFNTYKNKIIIHISHHFDNVKYDQIINLTARKEKIC